MIFGGCDIFKTTFVITPPVILGAKCDVSTPSGSRFMALSNGLSEWLLGKIETLMIDNGVGVKDFSISTHVISSKMIGVWLLGKRTLINSC